MKKMYINLHKVQSLKISGILSAIGVLLAVIILSYLLFHNPHQNIHKQIFKTAENIRSYYRDAPSYWKLSTATAKEDNLIAADLLKLKNTVLVIGQGKDGDISMPNDISFDIALKNLSKSACINLSEFSVSKLQQLGLQKITIYSDDIITEFSWGGENPLPIKRYATRKICKATDNIVIWTFQ